MGLAPPGVTIEEAADAENQQWDDLQSEINAIQQAIDQLGGQVLPKLNWTAPKDATWMLAGETMRCSEVSEILILLKASDFISHDLNCAFEHCCDQEEMKQSELQIVLNLRKWSNLIPSREFRVFVKNLNIVGICQRDHRNYYPHLNEPDSQRTIQNSIEDFFEDVVRPVDIQLESCKLDFNVNCFAHLMD
jgi:hypothetical protein